MTERATSGRVTTGRVTTGRAATEPSSGEHHFDVRVYYEDTDAGGVVYHANYLRFAERARTEALRDAGAPHAELVADHGLMFMVRRAELDYLAPARLDDRLVIATATLKLRGASVELRQSVLRHGAVLAVLGLQMVCVRCADGRPDRIPQRWLDVLDAVRA